MSRLLFIKKRALKLYVRIIRLYDSIHFDLIERYN